METEPNSTFSAILGLLVIIAIIAAFWRIFTKANQPGWAILVPFYNLYVITQIVGRPAWWLILMCIPLVNLVVFLIVYIDLARSFGKGLGFGLGLFFLGFIFGPILGFGSAQYQGPAVSSA